MAFTNLDAGAARTRIRVQRPVSVDDGGGNEIDTWEDAAEGSFAAVWRRKLTRFDSAIDNRDNERVYAPETAVVSVRFTKRITASCRVFRIGDDQRFPDGNSGAWTIIGTPERSVDGGWLEFTVERKVKAL